MKKLLARQSNLLNMYLKGLELSLYKDMIVDVLETIEHLCNLDQKNNIDILKTCFKDKCVYN